MRRQPLSPDDAGPLATRIKAVAHPNRLRILSIIAARPGIAAYQVVGLLGDLAQPTVTVHLRMLKAAGLVDAAEPQYGFVTPLTVSRTGMRSLAGAIRRLR